MLLGMSPELLFFRDKRRVGIAGVCFSGCPFFEDHPRPHRCGARYESLVLEHRCVLFEGTLFWVGLEGSTKELL